MLIPPLLSGRLCAVLPITYVLAFYSLYHTGCNYANLFLLFLKDRIRSGISPVRFRLSANTIKRLHDIQVTQPFILFIFVISLILRRL